MANNNEQQPTRKTWIMYKKAVRIIPYEKPTKFYMSGTLAAYDALYNVTGGYLPTDKWISYPTENEALSLPVNKTNWTGNGYTLNGDTFLDFSNIGKDKWSLSIELGLELQSNSSGCICEITNYRGELIGLKCIGTKVYAYRSSAVSSSTVNNPRYLRLGYASYKNTSGKNIRCSRQRADAGTPFGDNNLFSTYAISLPKNIVVGSNCSNTNPAKNIKLQYIKISGAEWPIWNDYDYAICKQNYNAIINRYET